MTKQIFIHCVAISVAALALASCGDGGSSPVASTPPPPPAPPPPPPPPTFTTWSAIPAPGSIAVNGVSQEVTYTASTTAVVTVSPYSGLLATTYTPTIDASRAITDIVIKNSNRTITFSKSAGDSFQRFGNTSIITARNPSGSNVAVAVDPALQGWDYQSFGVWITGAGTGSGSAGAVSVGAQTAGSAIPTTGSATFTGLLGGTYLDPAGGDHLVGANLTVNADFAGRSLALSSSMTTDISTGAAMPGLDLTGGLTYAAQTNTMTGTLSAANGRLSGPATGYFFGPAAQEIGGIFSLSATSGLERFGGGFGGRRP